MPGRLTGTARHLFNPTGQVYFATMEEGLYEVDMQSLDVKCLIRDGNALKKDFAIEIELPNWNSELPGYHGKGLYTGQERLIYANNGDQDPRVMTDPTTPSGSLAEWLGSGDWQMVRRNQFTEVTGPGGLAGSQPNDPVWSIGWDAKSLILMLLDGGKWQAFRLPKVSHSYDGAHGWNTEWPRIREIGDNQPLLMTMHGAFWSFPRSFSNADRSGIRVRSAYLKVIGDFARWNDRLVLGCDDSAKSEFLNKRSVKGTIDSIGQSQSNLWFTSLDTPDRLGPAFASGSVWLHESVKAGDKSDPFLIAGWKHRSLWRVDHATGQSKREEINSSEDWLTVIADRDCPDQSVVITLSNGDSRGTQSDPIFDGIARVGDTNIQSGLLRPRGENKRTLSFSTSDGYYELDGQLKLNRVQDDAAKAFVERVIAIPQQAIELDQASVLVTDDRGRRWRLPRASQAYDQATADGELRVCREVATERDMLSACGTFFELPAENADGFAKIRPICSHNLYVRDFGSYRGLFLVSGVRADAAAGEHIIRSDDGRAALWAGVIDDLWKLGKPRGEGGPWKNTEVKAGQPSDPYLMWAYDKRSMKISHDRDQPVKFDIEIDLTGTGLWVQYGQKIVPPSREAEIVFEDAIQARWLRVRSESDCTATAWLVYE
jgi:hypothetical protein